MTTYNIELVDVKGDGDCFYRAIYGFAMTNDILNKLFGCFNCNIIDLNTRSFIVNKMLKNGMEEDNWIQCIRLFLSSKILHDPKCKQVIIDFYDSITKLPYNYKIPVGTTIDKILEDNYTIYKENEIPSWFYNIFPTVESLKSISKENFIIFIANNIKNKGTWAFNSIDTKLMNLLMEKCGLKISEHTSLSDSEKIPEYPTIYIDDDKPFINHNKPFIPVFDYTLAPKKPIIPVFDSTLAPKKPVIPVFDYTLAPEKPVIPDKKRIITSTSGQLYVGGSPFIIYLYNQGAVHYNFITWVPVKNNSRKGISVGGKVIRNKKIFIKNKIYRKYYDKTNKKYYIKKNNKKIFVK